MVHFSWASGSHSVCVCTIHQNVLLLVKAVNLDYHDLIDMIVCDHTSRECMIHRCEICPGLAPLREYLVNELCVAFDEEEEQTISFKQWTNTESFRTSNKNGTSDGFH